MALETKPQRKSWSAGRDSLTETPIEGLSTIIQCLSLEDTVPQKARWWAEASERYCQERWESGEWSAETKRSTERCLVSWPTRFASAGLPEPSHARDVTPAMVLAWKERPMGPGRYSRSPAPMKPTSAFTALFDLRGFLRWAGAPIASKDAIWKTRKGDATNRRWLTGAQIDRCMAVAPSDRHRMVLALGAWAGLRRREIFSLRVGDVSLAIDRPVAIVLRKGGERKEVPLSRAVANAIRPLWVGRDSSEKLYPLCYTRIQYDLRDVARLAGIPALSCHDLRRSFGRILYYERKVPMNTIRALYNHASTEMTAYYIGEDSDRMRDAVETFDRFPEGPGPRLAAPPMGA